MTCVHLKALYQLCHEHDLRFSGTDLVRIYCRECNAEEVCPSVLTDEYDAAQTDDSEDKKSADGN